MQLHMLRKRAEQQGSLPATGTPADAPRPQIPRIDGTQLLADATKVLPFALTGSQQKALEDVMSDLKEEVPMLRLLQGDVGSGKTVVALISMLAAAASGGGGL